MDLCVKILKPTIFLIFYKTGGATTLVTKQLHPRRSNNFVTLYLNLMVRLQIEKKWSIKSLLQVSWMSRDECFAQLTRAALRQPCRMLLSKPRNSQTREESN